MPSLTVRNFAIDGIFPLEFESKDGSAQTARSGCATFARAAFAADLGAD